MSGGGSGGGGSDGVLGGGLYPNWSLEPYDLLLICTPPIEGPGQFAGIQHVQDTAAHPPGSTPARRAGADVKPGARASPRHSLACSCPLALLIHRHEARHEARHRPPVLRRGAGRHRAQAPSPPRPRLLPGDSGCRGMGAGREHQELGPLVMVALAHVRPLHFKTWFALGHPS